MRLAGGWRQYTVTNVFPDGDVATALDSEISDESALSAAASPAKGGGRNRLGAAPNPARSSLMACHRSAGMRHSTAVELVRRDGDLRVGPEVVDDCG